MFFKSGVNTGSQYRGPYESRNLIEFINEQCERTNKVMVSAVGTFKQSKISNEIKCSALTLSEILDLLLLQDESQLLIAAGCKRKEWLIDTDGVAYDYQWKAIGGLLEDRSCVDDSYQKHVMPGMTKIFSQARQKRSIDKLVLEELKTNVYTTIEYQNVREVDDKKGLIFIDITLTTMWEDPSVRFKFSSYDRLNGGMQLGKESTKKIWTPDLRIKNRTFFTHDAEWNSLISARILAPAEIQKQIGKHVKTNTTSVIEMRHEIKVSVYCHFDHSSYPMDQQTCNVNIGSSTEQPTFVLHSKSQFPHLDNSYESANFNMSIKFFDQNIGNGSNTIGIHVTMCRLQMSYVFMYYIPGIAIVLVSLIGFVIPASAIPGRVGLLVTQFLTLINLFIYELVSIFQF